MRDIPYNFSIDTIAVQLTKRTDLTLEFDIVTIERVDEVMKDFMSWTSTTSILTKTQQAILIEKWVIFSLAGGVEKGDQASQETNEEQATPSPSLSNLRHHILDKWSGHPRDPSEGQTETQLLIDGAKGEYPHGYQCHSPDI